VSGSCRDLAVLMMEAVRSLRLAAQFVSGYLYVDEHRRRARVGGGATHAWLRVYLPGAGWVEFDPTNGIVGSHDLIRVAVVRDPRQAVPVSGTWTGFPSDALGMTVEVEVTAENPAEFSPPPAEEEGEAREIRHSAISGEQKRRVDSRGSNLATPDPIKSRRAHAASCALKVTRY
jgi:hypothetical protein